MGMCAIRSIHNVTTNRPSLQIMILQIPLYLMKYHLQPGKYIYGEKKMQNPHIIIIQHTCRDWTTLFIEYFNTEKQMYGNYIINDDENTSGIFIGSRDNNTQFLTGAISGIEMYYTKYEEKELPNPLKQLMIQNQMAATKKTHISRRLIRNHEPLKKKKKIYSVNNIPYFSRK